jgi:predicted component of type VI protein secretion system
VEIVYRDGTITVTDLGTSNGTKLDGELIPGNVNVPYREGQRLTLGQSEVAIHFEFYRD